MIIRTDYFKDIPVIYTNYVVALDLWDEEISGCHPLEGFWFGKLKYYPVLLTGPRLVHLVCLEYPKIIGLINKHQ